jgi:hypothetical protein
MEPMRQHATVLIFGGLLLAALVASAGCGGAAHLSAESVRNAPYALPGIGTIRFTDGSYDRAGDDSLHVGQIDLFVFGDLDGDGREDALTFVSQKARGPELYLSMEAFLNRDGRPVHAAGYRLGDRVAIDSVTIDRRIVNLYLITQGPDDAPCCPTLHVRRQVALDHGEFSVLPDSGGR